MHVFWIISNILHINQRTLSSYIGCCIWYHLLTIVSNWEPPNTIRCSIFLQILECFLIALKTNQSKEANKIEEIDLWSWIHIQIPCENIQYENIVHTPQMRIVHTSGCTQPFKPIEYMCVRHSRKSFIWKVVDFAHLFSGALFPSPHFPYVPKRKRKPPSSILLSMAVIKLNAIYTSSWIVGSYLFNWFYCRQFVSQK